MMAVPTPLRNVRRNSSSGSTPRRRNEKRRCEALATSKDRGDRVFDRHRGEHCFDSPSRKQRRSLASPGIERISTPLFPASRNSELFNCASEDAVGVKIAMPLAPEPVSVAAPPAPEFTPDSAPCPAETVPIAAPPPEKVPTAVPLGAEALPAEAPRAPEPHRCPCFLGSRLHELDASAADRAVNRALELYEGMLESFGRKQKEQRGSGGWGDACERAEAEAAQHYEELVELVGLLLPWAGCCSDEELHTEGKGEGKHYRAVQFQGSAVKSRHAQDCWGKMLAIQRATGRRGRVRDAVCAALAALASRREMSWLEAYDTETPVRGYFAHALVDPSSVFRISMKGVGANLRPASLLLTNLLPLEEALQHMDSGGPLKGVPMDPKLEAEREFALQEIVKGGEPHTASERQPLQSLVPDERIKKLLRTKELVISIDAYVALAPRAVCKDRGFSDVIRAELRQLLAHAKSQRQAVVFQLGGGAPHALAEKVYLRPDFEEYGLRCGYLRWRPCAGAPWAREQNWQYRALIGLQVP